MHNKKELRKKFSQIRKNCDKSTEQVISDYFLSSDEYKTAGTIYAYFPFRDEFDTTPIISKALSNGKFICLPKCNTQTNTMNFYEIKSIETDLAPGSYNIPEPINDKITEKEPDIFIVPALSCDNSGARLGYGGGYYDRYLANYKSTLKVVLMHEAQLCEHLPTEETDIPVDIIITERGCIKTL